MFQGPPPSFPVGPAVPIPPTMNVASNASVQERNSGRSLHSMSNQGPHSQPLALPAPPPTSVHQIVAERLAAIASTSRRSPPLQGNGRGSVDRNQGGNNSFLRSTESPSGRRAMSSPIPSNGVQVRRETRSEGSNHSSPSPTHHSKNLIDSIAMSLSHQVSCCFVILKDKTLSIATVHTEY